MKLYHHLISTTRRLIMLFAVENHIPLKRQVVDLFTGKQDASA